MNPVVQLTYISKTFPGVNALQGVSLELFPGEVHALMGENGAGKSTLMKVLAGVYQADAGKVVVDGQERHFRSTREALQAGVRMIFQELTVLPNLDVARNILLGREPRRGELVDEKALYQKAAEILASLKLKLPVRTKVEGLSLGQQQMVEIARAIADDPKVIVMDEPTSSLGRHEDEALFALIEQLRARGVAVVYISHRMEEVFRLADRITVLRDGQVVGTRWRGEVDEAGLIEMMIGRKLEPRSRTQTRIGGVVLEVKDLRAGSKVKGVSFQLRRGEVLGLAGLVGAGRTETARAIFGVDPIASGEILLDSQPVRFRSPEEAITKGIVYVPEDRKGLGLVLIHSIKSNMALPSLRYLNRLGVVDNQSVNRMVDEYIGRLRIKTPSPDQVVEYLSGGNQQKVVLAKWLATKPHVLILDEPTRGIDVQAKAEVYALVREVAAQGVAVLLISSETAEILRESDRILVMHQGQIVGELDAASATEKQVVTLAFGQAA